MPGDKVDSEKEIIRLQEQLKHLGLQLDSARTDLILRRTDSEVTRAKVGVVEQEIGQKELEIAGLEKELSFLQMSPEEYSRHLKDLDVEKKKIEQNILESEKDSLVASEKINNFNAEEELKKQKVFRLQDEMQKAQTNVNEAVNSRNELKIQLAKLETKQEDLANEVTTEMSISIVTLSEKEIETIKPEELAQVADDVQKLKYQLSLIGGIDEDVTSEYEQTKEKFDFLTSQLDDLNKASADLDKLIVELTEIMKKKRSASFKKIQKEFGRYFKILFEGGSAELQEIYGYPEEEQQEQGAFSTLADNQLTNNLSP